LGLHTVTLRRKGGRERGKEEQRKRGRREEEREGGRAEKEGEQKK
jgi:hypothetical protein